MFNPDHTYVSHPSPTMRFSATEYGNEQLQRYSSLDARKTVLLDRIKDLRDEDDYLDDFEDSKP